MKSSSKLDTTTKLNNQESVSNQLKWIFNNIKSSSI